MKIAQELAVKVEVAKIGQRLEEEQRAERTKINAINYCDTVIASALERLASRGCRYYSIHFGYFYGYIYKLKVNEHYANGKESQTTTGPGMNLKTMCQYLKDNGYLINLRDKEYYEYGLGRRNGVELTVIIPELNLN